MKSAPIPPSIGNNPSIIIAATGGVITSVILIRNAIFTKHISIVISSRGNLIIIRVAYFQFHVSLLAGFAGRYFFFPSFRAPRTVSSTNLTVGFIKPRKFSKFTQVIGSSCSSHPNPTGNQNTYLVVQKPLLNLFFLDRLNTPLPFLHPQIF